MSRGITPTDYIVDGEHVRLGGLDFIAVKTDVTEMLYFVDRMIEGETRSAVFFESKLKKIKKNRIFFKNRIAIVKSECILSLCKARMPKTKT